MKNINLKIKEEVYNKLEEKAAKRNLDIESYICKILEVYNDGIYSKKYIEEKVKKPLNDILSNLKILSNDDNNNKIKSSNSNSNNINLKFIPLKEYNKSLPQKLNDVINYYKNKNWYDDSTFYLVTDKKRVLGYLGLNIFEEDPPYGKYVFIYALNLYKDYQNIRNLKYIVSFIQSIARKFKCYSMDVLSKNCNITESKLKNLGFLDFIEEDIIKIHEEKNEIGSDFIKKEQICIQDLMEFKPICRAEPLKCLYNKWQDEESVKNIKDIKPKKHILKAYKVLYNFENNKIEFVYVEQKERINSNKYDRYTILVKSDYLYDDDYIVQAFNILNYLIYKENVNTIYPIVSIPRYLSKNIHYYSEEKILYSDIRLRKNKIN